MPVARFRCRRPLAAHPVTPGGGARSGTRPPGRDHPRDRPRRTQPGTFPRLLAHALAGTGLVTAIPAILLALAALAGSLFTQERTVIQQADAYTEMLTADVPLSAYTDNGFAAHLQGGMMRTSASARDR